MVKRQPASSRTGESDQRGNTSDDGTGSRRQTCCKRFGGLAAGSAVNFQAGQAPWCTWTRGASQARHESGEQGNESWSTRRRRILRFAFANASESDFGGDQACIEGAHQVPHRNAAFVGLGAHQHPLRRLDSAQGCVRRGADGNRSVPYLAAYLSSMAQTHVAQVALTIFMLIIARRDASQGHCLAQQSPWNLASCGAKSRKTSWKEHASAPERLFQRFKFACPGRGLRRNNDDFASEFQEVNAVVEQQWVSQATTLAIPQLH